MAGIANQAVAFDKSMLTSRSQGRNADKPDWALYGKENIRKHWRTPHYSSKESRSAYLRVADHLRPWF